MRAPRSTSRLHASDPRAEDGGSRKDIGHTSVIGPTGSGKTVLIGFLVCMLTKARTTQVLFDKDRGLEILVRALGGRYLPLKNGVPTGHESPAARAHAEQRRILKNAGCAGSSSGAIGRSPCARRATWTWRSTAR